MQVNCYVYKTVGNKNQISKFTSRLESSITQVPGNEKSEITFFKNNSGMENFIFIFFTVMIRMFTYVTSRKHQISRNLNRGRQPLSDGSEWNIEGAATQMNDIHKS